MENKETNQVCESVAKTNGGKVAGLVIGALGVLGGIAAAVIYKKKKSANSVEVVTEVDDNEEIVEE